MQHVKQFQAAWIDPGDERYDDARALFNAMIDRHPAVIAQCETAEQVADALAHARKEGMRLAVRAGGHSVAGMSMVDDGVVVDVRPMKSIDVFPEERLVRVGAGVTWAELDAATQEHGLATTGGRVSTTGVAGFTLGGGSGWLERSFGLACDNLVAAEMVTAEGEQIRASETENADLLWALRGGGGNFGVVTSLELRLHEVGPVLYGGLAAFDPADAAQIARAFRDFYSPGPDAAGLALVFLYGPPEEFIPEEWQGRLLVGVGGCWAGDVAEGEAALEPLLEVADPIVNLFGPIPYVEMQKMLDDPPGLRNWWTADYLSSLPDEAIDAFCGYSESMPAPSQSILFPWGGEVARRGGTTPMAQRDAMWIVHPFALWEDPRDDVKQVTWGRRSHKVFEPWTSGGVYLNFVGEEGQDRVRAAFGESYDRLAEVKRRLDPGNLFSGNQNIRPAAAA